MTVTYSDKVPNAKLAAFSRLLFYWKGSIYKLMYQEMIVFIALYSICSLIYRFALNPWQRDIFEKIALHCEIFTNLIPLSFVLGFYVAIVVTRWWNQFLSIPWPDRLSLYVMTLVEGFDDHARLVRRTIMRYVMQSTLITLQATSVSVKKRFPTMEHLIEAAFPPLQVGGGEYTGVPLQREACHWLRLNPSTSGRVLYRPGPVAADLTNGTPPLSTYEIDHPDQAGESRRLLYVLLGVMTPTELQMMDEVNTPHGKWWVPFNWCFNLVKDARVMGLITDDYLLKTIMEELMTYRGSLGMLYNYDWISIPLVYTQVTTLAVYTFFIGSILGRQFLDPAKNYPGHDVDLFVPIFTLLQFFFYMGWLKVAEQMINPFGEDDDDFDMNWIIDRNMQVSIIAVDELYGTYPKLEKDVYWDEAPPAFLPYTKSALSSIKKPFIGSTADISISEDQMKVINPMETIQEEPQQRSYNFSNGNLGSKLTSNLASPIASPHHSRHHLPNNLLMASHLRSQLSLSKSTLDGLKFMQGGEKVHDKPLVQTINGASTLPKAPSYIDGWLNQEPGSRFDISTVPAHLPSPLTHNRALSQALARESQMMAAAAHCDGIDSASMFSMEKPESSVAPSVSPSVVGVAASVVQSASASLAPSIGPSMSPSVILTMEDDVTKVTLEEPGKADAAAATAPDAELSSSSESLPEYEQPDSNQCTVNSLTPLLKSAGMEETV